MCDAAKPTASEVLATPVESLRGVGAQRGQLFARLGIHTLRDLLFFFPRDYHDLSDVRTVAELEEGKPVTVRGTVVEVDERTTLAGRHMFGILVRQDDDFLRALWFNQPYMRDRVKYDDRISLFGKARWRGGRWEMSHPRLDVISDEEETPAGKLLPVYPLTEGLKQHEVRRTVAAALQHHVEILDEVFSDALLNEYDLAPLRVALPAIHFPASQEALQDARRRLIFQELFVLQLALSLRRKQHDQERATPLPSSAKIDSRIRRLLPFELTGDQLQAIQEVTGDMDREVPMNRLLQGDVGSGKTVVAIYAMLVCVANRRQAALMAPTEVLAQQHARILGRTLAQSHVRTAQLTGGLSAKSRQETLAAIREGRVDVVIGTQAIVSGGVEFADLGLVVIDEQHRFGVRQRAALKQAGRDPHYLVMTATPIPRTVSMTLFGDLDVSTLREHPPGRAPLHTYLISPDREARWWEFVRKKLREGRQAFVIAPLVSESANLDVDNVEATYEQLAGDELEAFRVDLLHGRMNAEAKQQAMEKFAAGDTQVLVATSVVEVGVDVPNATLMTILGAERFGLAQLHQMRGRISRGSHPGFCGIQSDPQTSEARTRLEALVSSTDGFELAELDYQLRGPGDLFSARQHGLPPLRIADPLRDSALLAQARTHAQALIARDADLTEPGHALLRRMVLHRYGEALDLGDVG